MKNILSMILLSLLLITALPLSQIQAEDTGTVSVTSKETAVATKTQVELTAKVEVEYTVSIPTKVNFGTISKSHPALISKDNQVVINNALLEEGHSVFVELSGEHEMNVGKGEHTLEFTSSLLEAIEFKQADLILSDLTQSSQPYTFTVETEKQEAIKVAGDYTGTMDYVVSYGTSLVE